MLGLLKFLLNLEPCKTMTVAKAKKKIDYKKTSQLSKHENGFYFFKAHILPMEVLGSPHCDAFRFLADLFWHKQSSSIPFRKHKMPPRPTVMPKA